MDWNITQNLSTLCEDPNKNKNLVHLACQQGDRTPLDPSHNDDQVNILLIINLQTVYHGKNKMHLYWMTNLPLPGSGVKILHFERAFVALHYFILSLFDLSQGEVRKIFRSPECLRWPTAMGWRPLSCLVCCSSYVNIFFSWITGPILTKVVCSICTVGRRDIVNFMIPHPKGRYGDLGLKV